MKGKIKHEFLNVIGPRSKLYPNTISVIHSFEKELCNKKDSEILNSESESLNGEALDVLSYQALKIALELEN